ncbi:MAG: hypothetical protein M5R36_25580 [Deltaproteobacteria bacterium]|nr:hypothetical protein [Deltaproteobacteria bacterium]
MLLFCGALIGAIEVGLRLMGFAYRAKVDAAAKPVEFASDFVLCVGDSHTAGVGAPAGSSYPEQLGAKLNLAETGDRRWQVLNYGHPGFNSSQAANRALNFLWTDERPLHAVIFNAGKNNEHNLADARVLPDDVRHLGMGAAIAHLLADSRAFRFGQITLSRLEALTDKSEDELSRLHYGAVLDNDGAEEQAFLADWLVRDLDVVHDACRTRGVPLFVLNYFQDIAWLDAAMKKIRRGERRAFYRRHGISHSAAAIRVDRKEVHEPGRAPQ